MPATRVRTSPTVHPIYFCIANTGKETIALDFRDPDAKTFLTKLIAKADVAVENFRPGVMTTTGVLESEGGRQSRVGISASPTPWPSIHGYAGNDRLQAKLASPCLARLERVICKRPT
ncbi:MAG: CoA transferase [Aeriscardovia sp.]|nr:CoA transferase [Aeriscardovia sp.]